MSRVLFCNIAYMKFYNGITQDDRPINGGEYVRIHGDAEEKNNFRTDRDVVHGFVETHHHSDNANGMQPNQIHIERIDKAFTNAEQIEDVTVFFCATPPLGKRIIVGWYKKATVFRNRQFKEYFGDTHEFNIWARSEDAYLIPVDKRTFEVPRGKGAFGRSQLWYAEEAPDYVESALQYIKQTEDSRGMRYERETAEHFRSCRILV
ncbi:MAG: hypothetical protein IKQ39_00015 [Oscillospiraceae bacterium]|nr:hypothetical protein [Oscillospiraceae bacterium]